MYIRLVNITYKEKRPGLLSPLRRGQARENRIAPITFILSQRESTWGRRIIELAGSVDFGRLAPNQPGMQEQTQDG
jgi:hypothetical protein